LITREEYAGLVKQASMVLKGNAPDLIKSLRSEMEERSQACDFERAILLRDRIAALEHLSRRQDIARKRDTDEDIVNYILHDGTVYLMLFSASRGTLCNKKEFVFEGGEDFFEEFLVQYYSDVTPPGELVLPVHPGAEMEEFLSLQRGRR